MTLSRLQAFRRQFTTSLSAEQDNSLQGKLLTALGHTIEQEAKVRVEAAEKLQKKAEGERDESRKEVTRLTTRLERVQEEYLTRIETYINAMKTDYERMESNFKEELKQVQTLLEKMRTESAAEQRALASMVAEHKAAMDMCAKMEREILGIKSAKPVQPPAAPAIMPASEHKPVTLIPKRDEVGRIVSISVVPTT